VSVPSGLLVVDKPAGLTSHDVVARVRRIAGTRRVGHAGTLDPAATGVLLLGIEKGTKLLGHLALTDKDYTATIRLGWATTTDDAEGEPVHPAGLQPATAEALQALTEADLRRGIGALSGTIRQVPSSVSAVKVGGQRAYARVRAGEDVVLAAREVTVSVFELERMHPPGAGLLDVDVRVTCSSGTYIRALARDLGSDLGVGGHLTVLRRTRVGPYGLDAATPLADLPEPGSGARGLIGLIGLAAAVDGAFPRLDVDAGTARAIGFGQPVAAPAGAPDRPHGVFGPDGELLALMEPRGSVLASLVVFAARS
jgi:tRNA pseudouridine55 synthase